MQGLTHPKQVLSHFILFYMGQNLTILPNVALN